MPLVTVDIDEKALARAQARLAKYEGQTFKRRMEAAFRTGAGLLVRPERAAAPNLTGRLARSVSVRKGRPPAGYIVQYGTKPRARHSHLLSKGHRIVTPSGRDTGRSTAPHPFIEDTIRSHEDKVVRFIADNVSKEGISVAGLGLGAIGGFE